MLVFTIFVSVLVIIIIIVISIFSFIFIYYYFNYHPGSLRQCENKWAEKNPKRFHQCVTVVLLEACSAAKILTFTAACLRGQKTSWFNKKPQQLQWIVDVTLFSKLVFLLCFFSLPFSIPHICHFTFILLLVTFLCQFSLHVFFCWQFCSHDARSFILFYLTLYTASSTKMTYVSYSNHAMWRDHRRRRWRWRRGGGLNRRGTCCGGRAKGKEELWLSWLAEKVENRQSAQWNSSMRHFVLFPIKSQRWDHINSQSVCLLSCCSQLIGPTMNLPVLKKKKKRNNMKKSGTIGDCGGKSNY